MTINGLNAEQGGEVIAYHGKQETKDFYLKRVQAHALADEIIKGQYWAEGKGCAIGCTIHGSDHSDYEKELGIPEWLARVEDTIFEGLPNERAKLWPEQFLKAIRPGVDLEKLKTPFLIFLLEENLKTLDALPDMSEFSDIKDAVNLSREAIKERIRCHREGLDLSVAESAWSAARSAASAASAARSAAWSVARSAASAAWSAASAARSAAESAAWSTASAARSAAESAAWSTASAAESAAWSAESAAYEKYADKLIELLEAT